MFIYQLNISECKFAKWYAHIQLLKLCSIDANHTFLLGFLLQFCRALRSIFNIANLFNDAFMLISLPFWASKSFRFTYLQAIYLHTAFFRIKHQGHFSFLLLQSGLSLALSTEVIQFCVRAKRYIYALLTFC